MLSHFSTALSLPKPSLSLSSFPSSKLTTNLRFHNRLFTSTQWTPHLKNPSPRAQASGSRSTSPSDEKSAASRESASASVEEEDTEATQLFEKLKDAELERIGKLEKFENKADIQLERQLVMASSWSRTLLTLQGKLKGTEWDPENSHKINFSEFMNLLNSNNVQYMEYSNFGQSVSVLEALSESSSLQLFDLLYSKLQRFI